MTEVNQITTTRPQKSGELLLAVGIRKSGKKDK
jgi:hypothetical protein